MCISFVIKSLINHLIRAKHIIIFVIRGRLFRQYWIYLFMSSVLLLIQLILGFSFYSSYDSSLESKIHNKFAVNEKIKKISVRFTYYLFIKI